MNNLPKDPVMLLSFVNTKLRDDYSSLSQFCQAFDTTEEYIKETLKILDYCYDESLNKFI